MNNTSRLIAAALVGAGLALAGLFVSGGLERFRMADRSISVKGLAEKDVESDFAIWTLNFRRAGNEFAGVQQALAGDREKVLGFLKQQGFGDEELEAKPLSVQDLLARDYAQGNVPFRFNGSGRIVVKTARVADVEKAALALDPLIQAGIQQGGAGGAFGFMAGVGLDRVIPAGIPVGGEGSGAAGPRYQLRGFNDVKAPLLAEATQNAREQAQKFAAEAGATLGPLKSANQGVIRISGDDGSDYDDGSSRTKRLRVVSSFEYELR
jgi:hypothetical protein